MSLPTITVTLFIPDGKEEKVSSLAKVSEAMQGYHRLHRINAICLFNVFLFVARVYFLFPPYNIK